MNHPLEIDIHKGTTEIYTKEELIKRVKFATAFNETSEWWKKYLVDVATEYVPADKTVIIYYYKSPVVTISYNSVQIRREYYENGRH